MRLNAKMARICFVFMLLSGVLFSTPPYSAKLLVMPGPTFQSATFFGGAGDQRGSAIGINGSGIYVAGYTQVGGLHGLLLNYAALPGSPVWSSPLLNTHFQALGLSATHAYPVGGAAPPVCGASDGVGDTERKSMLARFDSAGSFLNCGSTNFFPYRGHEGYNAAISVVEGSSTFVYTGGWAEQTGFSFSFPMVLTKHDAAGSLVNQVTEPGITLGTFGCCPGDSSIFGLAELGGNIYAAGHSRLPGFGEDNVQRPLLMRYDSGLNRIWKVRPTDNPGGRFWAVTAFGGALYAAGQAGSGSASNYLIEKYDTAGNRLWSVASGGGAEDVLTGVVGVSGRLFAVGYTRSSGAGGSDVELLEIDPSTGTTLSNTLYGGALDEQANGLATNGTDLYVVGEARSFASPAGNAIGQNDVLLLRYTLNQAPVALCQNVTVAADANCAATASINNGSYDPDGDAVTVTQSPAEPYPLGNTLVTLTVTDNKGASSQCTATVTVVDNTPPAITLNGANPMTVECHTGFSDPGATALDNCAGSVPVTVSGSVNSNVPGSYTLTYAATDGTNSASVMRTVNVVDTTAPVLTLKSPITLWPPNHKYTTVTTAQMVQGVSDSCATLNLSQVTIEQVTSDEPDNGLGDGDTANDIVIAPGCKAVQLRAERAGGGNGRVYSVRLRVQDGNGNSTLQEFKVNVPLSQNGSPAVEDAPVSTKTCGSGNAVLLPAVTGDFDGDRKTDLAIWRGSQGAWLVLASTNDQLDLPPWGASYAPYHDVLAPGDYDGDGKADQAVYRPSNGTFYVKGSATSAVITLALGTGQNEPVPGDYDGDGKTDFAVWQAASGTWLIQRSGGPRLALQWGSGVAPYFDVPVPADFDGDGQTDLAVYRRSTGIWYIQRSADGGVFTKAWGLATDVPVVGDYDGDGKADLAVWRGSEGNWYVWRSTDNQYQVTAWGAERVGDVPVPGDYDGDDKTDLAVWRVPEGKWYVRFSSNNTIHIHDHGQAGDTPVSSCRLP